MGKNLFDEFEEVSAKQWKQKIQYDLKGADYNKTLVWNSGDGVDVKPFYHPDEAPEPVLIEKNKGWNICEKIYVASAEKSNKNALTSIEKGAEALWFTISSEKIDPETLFLGIDLERFPIYLQMEFLSENYLFRLKDFLTGKKHQVFLQLDSIGKLARSGNWFHNLQQDQKIIDSILSEAGHFPSVLSIDSGLYQNAGANIPQQLAYAMAHANEYLNHCEQQNFSSGDKKKVLNLQFKVAIGPNYFFEIAKIRALRLLFTTLAKEYPFMGKYFILAQPSKRNKTLYDYNINLLRSTTECMSAILGGADSINNLAYDVLYHKDNEFSSRIARNQLLVLKNESYFEKVANPAEGSYYIETLTRQFAEKALGIFKEIEKGGGFLKQLKEGIIQKKISETATKEQEEFDSGERVLIGSNKFQNPQDKMENELELYPFLKQNPRKTLIRSILEKRLAERLEQERLKKET